MTDPEGFLPLGIRVCTKHVLRDFAAELSREGERAFGQHRIVSVAVRRLMVDLGRQDLADRIPEDPEVLERADHQEA